MDTTAQNKIKREARRQKMAADDWTPVYDRWRHGGWYVVNICYENGACGCVSRNYPDKQWRVVGDVENHSRTYPNRDAAAHAEREIAIASWGGQ